MLRGSKGGGGVGGWGLEPLLENSILLNLRSCKITKNISQTPPPPTWQIQISLGPPLEKISWIRTCTPTRTGSVTPECIHVLIYIYI